MNEMRETIDWHLEAMAVIKDVTPHVTSIAISDKLITGESSLLSAKKSRISQFPADVGIYLNLKTLEGQELTCYLDGSGFKIVGLTFDNCDIEDSSEEEIYETIYALIQSRSPGLRFGSKLDCYKSIYFLFILPGYTESFGNALVDKLNQLS